MAELSIMWSTSGTGDGATAYTMAQVTDWLRRTFQNDAFASEGVLKGYNNELAVSDHGDGTVDVATGAAYDYGYPYENSAVVNVAIPTPVGSTRIDRIVLRASWAAQTVRVTRIAGVEGAGAPALTQTPNVTYDLPLAQVSKTVGGVITITDERGYAHFATRLAVESVDGRLHRRQGGSATDWSTAGTNNYSPATMRVQAGVKAITVPDGATAFAELVVFPVVFSQPPIVVVGLRDPSAAVVAACYTGSHATSGVWVGVIRNGTSGAVTYDVHWIAIGPI